MTQGHPHAALAIQYWTLALTDPEPWKRVRGRPIGKSFWITFDKDLSWHGSWEYEIIPATLSINGHEYPEPLRVAPTVGTEYWIANPLYDGFAVRSVWANRSVEHPWLRRGRIHLTREAAEAHSRADILAAGGEV